MYTPLSIKAGQVPENQKVSLMGKKGVNLRDLPQLLDVDYALTIQNYVVNSDGGLQKRKGYEELYSGGATSGITMLVPWADNELIYSFENKVYAYNIDSNTSTTIKTDFTTSDRFSGVRYGDYFFICNKGDKIGRISRTLDYDTQTSDFTVGSVLTGGTSGATAIILEDSDSGVTGTLTLGNIVGTFEDDETITDSATGSASANGTVGYTYTEITNAPKAGILKIFGARLYAGDLEGDETAVQYSEIDDGSNPPFDSWSNGTGNPEGGKVYYRNGGRVRAIEKLGEYIVVLQEKGKFGFKLTQLDSAGTLKKIEQTAFEREDFGGSIASISTDQGIFYANEAGLWQMVAIGQQDIPFDDQEGEPSEILGSKYFDGVTLDNASIIYDAQRKYIWLSVAKDSDVNNFVIGYNTEFKAFSFLKGWNVNAFAKIDNTIYSGDSSSDIIRELFTGYADGENDIYTVFEQEIKTGDLMTRQDLLGFYAQGELSESTDITVTFNIFDRSGTYIPNKSTWQWQGASFYSTSASGWGGTAWGDSFGGAATDSETINTGENFDGCRPTIRNYQRLRVKFTSNDKVYHQINWFSIVSRSKAYIRRRGINQLT